MEISDASEIQLWKTGENSFNAELQGYTERRCFMQKFLCNGVRKLQVLGITDESQELRLSIMEKGIELHSIDFIQTDNSEPDPIVDPLEDATQSGVGTSWTLGSNPTITMPEGVEAKEIILELSGGIANVPLTFTFNLDASRVGGGGSNSFKPVFYLYDATFTNYVIGYGEDSGFPVYIGAGNKIHTIELTPNFVPSYIVFDLQAYSGGGYTWTFDINSVVIDSGGFEADCYLNKVAFNPIDLGLCDKVVTFKVYNKDESPDEELFHSDPVHFVSTWVNSVNSGRVVIEFKSSKNFAGLLYDDTSQYFSIELDARFRKNIPVTVNNSIILTNKIINTASSVKTHRELVINDVPDYMHRKIVLALAHSGSGSVKVDGIEITVEENYEEGDRPTMYPLTPASIKLTEKNFYKHNVI